MDFNEKYRGTLDKPRSALPPPQTSAMERCYLGDVFLVPRLLFASRLEFYLHKQKEPLC